MTADTLAREGVMDPDDIRHGSHAGAVQHFKDDTDLCPACRQAYSRYRKQLRHTHHTEGHRRVLLGQEAWDVLDMATPTLVVAATGLSWRTVLRLHELGPTAGTLRATRALVLAKRPPYTPVGIQRRLQALAAIGYSSPMLVEHVGSAPSSLNRIRTRPVHFVRSPVALRIVDAYERLHMTPMNVPTSSPAARTEARKGRWVTPMAWDDIDYDPSPIPTDGDVGVDEVAVERVLAGDRSVRLNRHEKFAATALWVSRGGSLNELANLTGWRTHRYVTREQVAA